MSRYLTRGDFLNIKKYRESLNLTQEDLANKLKVSRTSVAMWETNKAFPRADLLPKISKILNCNIKEILCKQLELLTEKEKDCTLEELLKINEEIIKISSILMNPLI